MANNHNIISDKFYNQYRNGLLFTDNLTEFTNKLQGNSGDIIQLIEVIEINTIVNETISIPITFHQLPLATYGKFSAPGINFQQEGLYPGATVQLDFDGIVLTNVQVQQITGIGNSEWTFDAADRTAILALLTNVVGGTETRTDFVMKVTTVPSFLVYDYGINPNSLTAQSYQSPLDNNLQSYTTDVIATSPSTTAMPFTGAQISADLGTVLVSFDLTLENYKHQFTIIHTFKIPYYLEGQQNNLSNVDGDVVNPANLISSNSLRYDNRYQFGANPLTAGIFPITGLPGNVGYYDENFNGGVSKYTIQNVVISNTSVTGTLESTEVNTVTFEIISAGGDWTLATDRVILTHSKLPKAVEYQNKTTAFDTIWIRQNILAVEGAAAGASGIFTAFTVARDGADFTKLNCSVVITYTAEQKAIIFGDSEYLLNVTVAHNNLSNPDLVDRVNPVVKTANFSANTDVSGLVTLPILEFYPAWSAFSGLIKYTDFSGGDGDFWGLKFAFTTQISLGALVESIRFVIFMDDDAGTRFEMLSIPIPIGKITTLFDGTFTHQLHGANVQAGFNLPILDVLNIIVLTASSPPAASPTQDWAGNIGFQVPHRDWIENLNVDNVFFDPAKPQNNQNEKSSNYAGVEGFVCYGVIELSVKNDVQSVPTLYRLYSGPTTVLDFDAAGWTGFTGVTKYFDADGDEVINIEETQDIQVKIDFDHSSGVLSLANLRGFVWIERDGSTIKPTFLSTSRNWTNPTNLLKPTDTLATGNNTLVEVISISNKVTFIFQTEKDNIQKGVNHNVMGKLWNAT